MCTYKMHNTIIFLPEKATFLQIWQNCIHPIVFNESNLKLTKNVKKFKVHLKNIY